MPDAPPASRLSHTPRPSRASRRRLWRVALLAGLAVLALLLTSLPLGASSPAAVGQPAGERPAVGRGSTWHLRDTLSTGPAETTFSYGRGSDIKVMGDWNGDGLVTPGVVRGNKWYMRNANSGGPTDIGPFLYGRTSDVKVVGDWNGDGIDTIGVVRGNTWILRNANSSGPAFAKFTYGRSTDQKVAGDWNRNGTETIGVFRDGEWILRNANSSGPAASRFAFGTAGDTPLTWGVAATTVPTSLRGTEWATLPTSRPVIALTFDAGGNDGGAADIMETLRAEGVSATFFFTGSWADRYPAVARDIGTYFPVGNHSRTHPDFRELTDAEIAAELEGAHDSIRAATGQDDRPLFRFPYGARDARTIEAVNDNSYGTFYWSIDTLGWQGTSGGQSAQSVIDRVVDGAEPGAIVLMHVGAHPTDGSTLDADALPEIIRELRARGYGFTTLREYT